MTRKLYLAAAVALLTCVGLAQLTSAVEVPLPGLAGGYEAWPGVVPDMGYPGVRTVSLTFPDAVTVIDDISLVISGQWSEGEITCTSPYGGYDVSAIIPPLDLRISSSAFPGDFFVSEIIPTQGAFEALTADLTSCCPPGVLEFSALLGAELHVQLSVDFALIGICSLTVDTYGELDDVHLDILGPVANEATTWGQLKSLYR